MQNAVSAYGPLSYAWVWWYIAGTAVFLLVLWYGFVWWLTRKKAQRLLATAPPKVVVPVDIPAIQRKYLALIDEVEAAHRSGALSSRTVHQKLSLLLRYFAQEAHGIRAYTLTLSDLKRTRYTQLTQAIDEFYVPEFQSVLSGDVLAALATARKVVSTWS